MDSSDGLKRGQKFVGNWVGTKLVARKRNAHLFIDLNYCNSSEKGCVSGRFLADAWLLCKDSGLAQQGLKEPCRAGSTRTGFQPIPKKFPQSASYLAA